MKGLFVTGTDTGVGKTRVAVALIHALRAQGLRVAAMKPVSAGSAPGELNEDVVALLQAANVAADVRDVNPYAFVPAIAPHIAAQQAGVRIDLDDHCRGIFPARRRRRCGGGRRRGRLAGAAE